MTMTTENEAEKFPFSDDPVTQQSPFLVEKFNEQVAEIEALIKSEELSTTTRGSQEGLSLNNYATRTWRINDGNLNVARIRCWISTGRERTGDRRRLRPVIEVDCNANLPGRRVTSYGSLLDRKRNAKQAIKRVKKIITDGRARRRQERERQDHLAAMIKLRQQELGNINDVCDPKIYGSRTPIRSLYRTKEGLYSVRIETFLNLDQTRRLIEVLRNAKVTDA